MRITKKMVRDAKYSIFKRTHELEAMDDFALEQEFHRVLPKDASEDNGRKRRREVMMLLVRDYVDRAIPEHWIT